MPRVFVNCDSVCLLMVINIINSINKLGFILIRKKDLRVMLSETASKHYVEIEQLLTVPVPFSTSYMTMDTIEKRYSGNIINAGLLLLLVLIT